jgi:WD40 repeat protein
VILLDENYTYVSQDEHRSDGGRLRLGVIGTQPDKIQWVTTIRKKELFLPEVWHAAVSEDGKYLVAVGTNNGGFIHLADVTQKKVLWEKVPMGAEVPDGDWTVNFNDVCFSPDSKYVYVGGNCGLFCFDVATGKILSQWEVPGRCMSVAVSPDGKLVAGGGGGTGFVYVYHTKTGQLLRRLQTGQFTIYGLAFSPDSTLLATSGVMNTDVKIWKMPSVDSESVEVGEPNETKR